MKNSLKRVALPIGAALVIGSSGFAFMANNSVLETRAGDGSNEISGYDVRNVSYDTDNGRIIAVRFDLNGQALPQNVEARIGSGRYDRGRTSSNENTAGNDGCQQTASSANSSSWLCIQNAGFVTATMADANELRVLAAQ